MEDCAVYVVEMFKGAARLESGSQKDSLRQEESNIQLFMFKLGDCGSAYCIYAL